MEVTINNVFRFTYGAGSSIPLVTRTVLPLAEVNAPKPEVSASSGSGAQG